MATRLQQLQRAIADSLGDTPFIRGFALVAGFLFALPFMAAFVLLALWEPMQTWVWGPFMGMPSDAWLGFWGNIMSGLVAALTAFYLLFASIGYEAYTWRKNRSHEVADKIDDFRISIALEISDGLAEINKVHGHNAEAFFYLSQKLRLISARVRGQFGWAESELEDAVAAMRMASAYFREYSTASSARREEMYTQLFEVNEACYALVEGLIENSASTVSSARRELQDVTADSGAEGHGGA